MVIRRNGQWTDGEIVTFPHAFKDTNAVGQTRRCLGAEIVT